MSGNRLRLLYTRGPPATKKARHWNVRGAKHQRTLHRRALEVPSGARPCASSPSATQNEVRRAVVGEPCVPLPTSHAHTHITHTSHILSYHTPNKSIQALLNEPARALAKLSLTHPDTHTHARTHAHTHTHTHLTRAGQLGPLNHLLCAARHHMPIFCLQILLA